MSQQRKVIRAAGLLVYRLNNGVEYLLLQASYKPHHWTPPKGHVDPGEDERAAAMRETQEEAGLGAEQLQVDEHFRHEMRYTVAKDSSTTSSPGGDAAARSFPKVVSYWLAKLNDGGAPDGVQLSHEHQAHAWTSLEEAVVRTEFPEMEQLLRAADAHLKRQQ